MSFNVAKLINSSHFCVDFLLGWVSSRLFSRSRLALRLRHGFPGISVECLGHSTVSSFQMVGIQTSFSLVRALVAVLWLILWQLTVRTWSLECSWSLQWTPIDFFLCSSLKFQLLLLPQSLISVQWDHSALEFPSLHPRFRKYLQAKARDRGPCLVSFASVRDHSACCLLSNVKKQLFITFFPVKQLLMVAELVQ